MVYRCAYARNKVATIGKVGLLTPAQARDQAKQILGDAAIGIHPKSQRQSSSMTLHYYLDSEYAEWRLLNRKNGQDDLIRLKVNFLENFGTLPLQEITPLLIEKWRSKKLSKGVKPATVNRDITVLKSSLAKAVEWGFIDSNPLITFKPVKVDKLAKVRYLDNEEVKRLRYVLDEREAHLLEGRKTANEWRREREYPELPIDSLDYMKSLILLSINTGLRRGEILNLTWENIILDMAVLTVAGDTAKSGKTRHIPLNAEALNVLKEWRQRTISQGLVFPGKNGESLKSVKRAWARILKLADIKNFRWHDLRHHFASKLAMGGVDLNTIRELLGHSDIQMTLRYAHLAPQHKAKAVAVLLEE
jgi:integrase